MVTARLSLACSVRGVKTKTEELAENQYIEIKSRLINQVPVIYASIKTIYFPSAKIGFKSKEIITKIDLLENIEKFC